MLDFFNALFFLQHYLPHGHCYLWQTGLVWLHLISDLLIVLAYYSIPLQLLYFVRQREDVPFKGIFVLFSLFIITCGTTHLMAVWTLWHPAYWLSGGIKALTALVSCYTALALAPILPQALALPSSTKLEAANLALEEEIAERKQAEQKLEETRNFLQIVIDQLPVAVFVKDGREENFSQHILWNKTSEILFGYSDREAIGKTAYQLFPQEQADFFVQKDREAFARGTAEDIAEEPIDTVSLGRRILHTVKVPLYDKNQEPQYLLCFSEDITERKQAENALRQLNQELENRVEKRTAEIKSANEQLQQLNLELLHSNHELEQFAYIASHDLQEPLRMVTSFTQLLAQRYSDKLDADANQIINFAVDGATRMQALIDDLLTYSRVGRKGKTFEPTDCEAVLKKALSNVRLLVEESGANISREPCPLPTIMADRAQIVQLLQNLLSNAIKYRNQHTPEIQIKAELHNEQWLFAVRDNGIGIDPKHFDRIFTIFQRLHTRNEYPGTGIGLAICQKIIERHSGKIWVESELGQGSTFYFTIPVRGQKSEVRGQR